MGRVRCDVAHRRQRTVRAAACRPLQRLDRSARGDPLLRGRPAPDPRASRQVKVSRDGVLLAETRRAKILFETGLPPRFYMPAEDVRTELLVPSSRKTVCAYKGSASYWSVQVGDRLIEDLVWAYPEPQHD